MCSTTIPPLLPFLASVDASTPDGSVHCRKISVSEAQQLARWAWRIVRLLGE